MQIDDFSKGYDDDDDDESNQINAEERDQQQSDDDNLMNNDNSDGSQNNYENNSNPNENTNNNNSNNNLNPVQNSNKDIDLANKGDQDKENEDNNDNKKTETGEKDVVGGDKKGRAHRKSIQARKSQIQKQDTTDGEGKQGEGDEKDENQKEELKGWEKTKYQMDQILEHSATTITMTIITLYALFGDDIRILVTDSSGDQIFWGFNILAMFAFTLEIVVSCLVKKDYIFGFFFWLDVISTLSLILDIGWISAEIFSTGSSNDAASAASLAKAGRASKLGAKAGKIVRIVRLIRLVKLYKHAQQALLNEIENQERIERELQQEQERQNNIQLQPAQALRQRPVRKKKHHDHKNFGESNKNLEQDENGEQKEKNDGEGRQSVINKGEKLPPIVVSNNDVDGMDKQLDGPSKPQPLNPYTEDPLLKKSENNFSDQAASNPKIQESKEQSSQAVLQQIGGDSPAKNDQSPIKINEQPEVQIDENKNNNQDNQNEQQKDKNQDEQKADQKDENNQNNNKDEKQGEDKKDKKIVIGKEDLPQETKVGQKLSDLTTKRVITLVMSIMISIPLFTTSTFIENTVSYDNGLYNILLFKDDESLMNDAMKDYVDYHIDFRAPVIYIDLTEADVTYPCCQIFPNDIIDDKVPNWKDLRTEEISAYTIEDDSGNTIGLSVVQITEDNELNAILSIIRTIFVSFLLSIASMQFSRDVEELVLNPIEKMLKKVQSIAKNPLEAAQIEERESQEWEELKSKNEFKKLDELKEKEKMETSILEKLIIKIGALLALGFGEAGSEIIAENMAKKGEVDPLIPGRKMFAVFGFCNIRSFADATEVLQQGVMIFVNEIAELTHGTVDQYCGQSNKNIGDAFLLVWKYHEDHVKQDPATNSISLVDSDFIHEQTDLPVLCFIKIISALCLSKRLGVYSEMEELQSRMPNFSVKMGYGLHVGWAIEGAIGSSFKIDASYLSPNVNMASRLEAATKQYGTMFLISGNLYQYLSPACQQECRLVDRACVKGSKEPTDLYTVDVNLENLVKNLNGADRFDTANLTMEQKKRKRVISRIRRNKLRTQIKEGVYHVADQFVTDREVYALRQIFYDTDFYDLWEEGFQYYMEGNWEEAIQYFQKTLNIVPGHIDGPSQTLINYIQEEGGQAPENWASYRELTEK